MWGCANPAAGYCCPRARGGINKYSTSRLRALSWRVAWVLRCTLPKVSLSFLHPLHVVRFLNEIWPLNTTKAVGETSTLLAIGKVPRPVARCKVFHLLFQRPLCQRPVWQSPRQTPRVVRAIAIGEPNR